MATNPTHSAHLEGWPKRGRAMSEEEYHRLESLSPDRKYEYIDGLACTMSGGSVAHDLISFNMRMALALHFRTGPCTAFGADVQVLVGTKKSGKPAYVYSDAIVSCDVSDRRPDNTLIEVPRVVVEVLSPGTEAKDRGKTLKAYKVCLSMQEVVLISQFAQHIELHRRKEEDSSAWNPAASYETGESIDLQSIDVQVAMAEIYRGLDFAESAQDEEHEPGN